MGNTWTQRVLVPTTSGKPKSFASINVASFAMDPSDKGALYFGSVVNSLVYTYDGASNWQVVKEFKGKTIRAVAVDPNSKCIIYAATANKVYKSSDCNRNWEQVYYDNDTKATVDAIAVDHYNSENVYITISRGDIVKSTDGGDSWQTIYRISKRTPRLIINPNDSRDIFAITSESGIYRTKDSGVNWQSMKDLSETMKKESLGKTIRDLIAIEGESGVLFLATKEGIIKSFDDGVTWERINVIPTEKKAVINSLAVNHDNYDEIFYVTNTTFYRSLDGGENWATKKLPTSRSGWKIILDPEDPNIIYMAVYRKSK